MATRALMVKSLGYAREINEAIDIVKFIYKKGAVYRYFDLGDMQEQSKAKLYNALKSVNKQYRANILQQRDKRRGKQGKYQRREHKLCARFSFVCGNLWQCV